MPFKNTSKFLGACLQSIINQTDKNWELIAVNDHSSDTSLKILESFALKDQRIQVLQNKGNGIIQALQTGYSISKGELITRMDSDDIMPSNKLEILSKNLLKFGKGHLSTGLVKYISEAEIGAGFQKYESWLNGLTTHGTNFQDIYRECVIPSPCWMVFREDFDALDGFNPNRYPEDYDLTFRFYEAKLKIIPSGEILHIWRDYCTRTSRTDSNYQDHSFIDIKLDYFLKLERDQDRELVVWGAGTKGKRIAKILIDKQIDFQWICDNPKKIGKDIYDKKMLEWTVINNFPDAQSIVSVASPVGQKQIEAYYLGKNKVQGTDYFFFC